MADSIPSAEAVVLMLTYCTVWCGPSARWSEIRRPAAQFRRGQVKHALCGRLGQLERARARGRPRPPWPPGSRSAAAPAVDQHSVDRVGRRVQRRLHPWEPAEGLPPGIVREAHLEDDAALVLDPGPLDRAAGNRRLDELGPVGVLPRQGCLDL